MMSDKFTKIVGLKINLSHLYGIKWGKTSEIPLQECLICDVRFKDLNVMQEHILTHDVYEIMEYLKGHPEDMVYEIIPVKEVNN